MAFDKNSNFFTFTFAILMVIIFGVLLTVTNGFMKPYQEKNAEIKKMMDILGAVRIEATRENAADLFAEYVSESYVIDFEGNRIDDGRSAFDIDIKKDYRDRSRGPEEKFYPLYKYESEGKTYYVVPMVGNGLWGPIWGFVSIEGDFRTLYGSKFDHKGETPGLGAEIKEGEFTDKMQGIWPGPDDKGKRLLNAEGRKLFEVLKGGSVIANESQVDGITGGTITSKGVEEMMDRTFRIYLRHFDQLN
jgi:Na+-transporting NADH:ubiquinone oxidoreductase subunit C